MNIPARKQPEEARELLYHLAHDLARAADLKMIAEHLFTRAQRLLGADAGWLQLVNAEGTVLTGVAAYGIAVTAFLQDTSDLCSEHSPPALALQTKQPVVVRDVAQSPLVSEQWRKKYPFVQGVWVMPLMQGERAVGTLTVSFARARAASPAEVRLLRLLGDQAALAIGRMQLAEEMQRSEKRFRALIEQSTDAVALLAADGTLLYVSPAGSRMFGRSWGENVGRNAFALIHPADVPSTTDQFRHLLHQPAIPITMEFRYHHQDDSWRWIEARGQNLLAEPSVAAIVVNYRDITERKKGEEALRSRVKMETLITAISTRFINLAPEEIDRGITETLHAIGEFAGVDSSYLFLAYDHGTKVNNTHEWCAPGIVPHLHAQQGLRAEDFPWLAERLRRLETIHIPRVGELPPEAQAEKALLQAQEVQSLIIVPVVYGGRPLGFLGFDAVRTEKVWLAEDIALLKMIGEIFANALERARGERELRSAKGAAEAANRTKSEFLATMSHELRTPLHVILGYAELMAEGEFGLLTDDQSKTLARIRRNALELHELITSVLDLSRLEAGRLPVAVTEVQVPAVLEELKAETQEAYQRSGLHFRWEVEAELMPISTDPEKLKVVLRNLIGNAVKFTLHGSITVQAAPQRGGVEIRVTDTGMGIPPEAVAVIFEPFHQVNGGVTRQYGGVGLGLHIVKRVLELLGGTVTVESEVGRGSTFRIWLPPNSNLTTL